MSKQKRTPLLRIPRVPEAVRRRQYECWRSGVDYKHSLCGGEPIGLENAPEPKFVWPDAEEASL